MVNVATVANQALLDAAEWAGVSVWIIAVGIAVTLSILLILVFNLSKRGSPIKIYATRGKAGDDAMEYVEKTLVEFPAEQIKIEATKGRVVIKLVSPKPAKVEESGLPQKVEGEPLPSKIEKSRPAKEAPAPKKEAPESEPIPMGAAASTPEEKKMAKKTK